MMWGGGGMVSFFFLYERQFMLITDHCPSLPFSTQRREFLGAFYFGTMASFIKRSMSA